MVSSKRSFQETEFSQPKPFKKEKVFREPEAHLGKINDTKNPADNRKEQKQIKLQRKQQKPHFDLIQRAKKLWEVLRQKPRKESQDKELRKQQTEELMNLVQGKILDIIFKHDCSRIIQTCLKVGSQEQRLKIAQELKGHYVRLMQDKFAKFLVLKILIYCGNFRKELITELYGNVVKLMRHAEASTIVEEIYFQYATGLQRGLLIEDLYGPEFCLFKTDTPRTLSMLLEQQPEKKEKIMENLYKNITQFVNKGIFQRTIAHRAMFEYISNASEAQIQDFISIMKEHLVEILHTKDGAKVAMLCLAYGTAKDRKVIIRSMKPYALKIAKEQYGHLVILAAFDTVDDTVLLRDNIFNPLFSELLDILKDPYGSHLFLFVLSDRSSRYLTPSDMEIFQQLDPIRQKTSKKSVEVRKAGLVDIFIPEVFKACEEHIVELAKHTTGSSVIYELFRHFIKLQKLENCLGMIKTLTDDLSKERMANETENTLLEDAISNRVIKNLIKYEDSESNIKKGDSFTYQLFNSIKPNVKEWCNKPFSGRIMQSLLESKFSGEDFKRCLKHGNCGLLIENNLKSWIEKDSNKAGIYQSWQVIVDSLKC